MVSAYSSTYVVHVYARACTTGARINAVGLQFFDTVSGALESDTAAVRAARRAVLYGVANALVRQQGYMLAQIVAEVHAPDLAVGDVGGAGEAVIGEDVGLSGYSSTTRRMPFFLLLR